MDRALMTAAQCSGTSGGAVASATINGSPPSETSLPSSYGPALLPGRYSTEMDERKWLARFLYLETVAGVPGMVAGGHGCHCRKCTLASSGSCRN